jgi:hypothetical protein
MNNILEVFLIVLLIFTPVFLLVEAVLFSSPKEWWLGIKNMFIKSSLFFKEKWSCRQMNTLQKINHISRKLNKESDLAKQKMLLEALKVLAEKYREEQEKIVHPETEWEVKEKGYKPAYRFIFLTLVTIFFYGCIFIMFDKPLDELKKTLSIASDDKSYSSFLIAFFGVIPALIVWFYRDLNNYRERETSLRDVMFSEHKQLVEWATTEAKKDKSESNESTNLQTTEINSPMIQVAGIYQLAPFLKDHHANLYQRSTLETLRAIVNASRPKWEQWVKGYEGWVIGHKQGDEPEKPQLTAAERAVHAVLRENPVLFYHNHFNAKDFNLAGFDGAGLVLIGCDLQEAQLRGSNLTTSQFQGANLYKAQLQGSDLGLAQFQCASSLSDY